MYTLVLKSNAELNALKAAIQVATTVEVKEFATIDAKMDNIVTLVRLLTRARLLQAQQLQEGEPKGKQAATAG